MKILVLNYEFPPLGGGAAPVSKDITLQLGARGHEVSVVTMGYKDLPAYEEIQGIPIYRVKCWRKRQDACKPWEQFTYLISARHFLKEHMKTHQYDICHTHFIIPTGDVAKWVKRRYGIPYVITAHGSDVEGYNSKKSMKIMHIFLRPFWRKIVDGSQCIISPSLFLKELLEHNYAVDKYVCIPNGIDYEKYHALASPRDKKKRILVMCRLQEWKNVQTVIKAVSKIDLADWKVDILGDGPYRGELEKLVKEYRLSDYVTFHGWLDNGSPKQLEFLKEASIYITASRFENCPMSVIEAIAAGCEPLLSDIPAHRQIIDDKDCFFAPDDDKMLADKIKRKTDGNRQREMLDVSRYDCKKVILAYEKLLMQEHNR